MIAAAKHRRGRRSSDSPMSQLHSGVDIPKLFHASIRLPAERHHRSWIPGCSIDGNSFVVHSVAAMPVFVAPGSAAAKMIRARKASAWAVFYRRVQSTRTTWSSSERVMETAKSQGMDSRPYGSPPRPALPPPDCPTFSDSRH
jgi:hypothetical protein